MSGTRPACPHRSRPLTGTRAPVSFRPLASPGHKLLFTSQPGGRGGRSFRSGQRLGGDSSGSGGRMGSHTQDWDSKGIWLRGAATRAMAGGLCLSPVGESPTPSVQGQAGWWEGPTLSYRYFYLAQGWVPSMWPLPSARHGTDGHLSSRGQLQPPPGTISRASSGNNLIQKAFYQQPPERLTQTLPFLPNILFIHGSDPLSTEVSSLAHITRATLLCRLRLARRILNRDRETAPSLWSPRGRPAAHARTRLARPHSQKHPEKPVLRQIPPAPSPAAAGPPGALGHPVWPWFCSFPVFQHLPETQAHYMAPCWFT